LQGHDFIGMVGGACMLVSYGLLQLNKIPSTSFAYLTLNLAGALLIMYSLLTDWNFTAFIIEAIWVLISLYAIAAQYFSVKPQYFREGEIVSSPASILDWASTKETSTYKHLTEKKHG
jgi:membrane-bound ClpP family serine protease